MSLEQGHIFRHQLFRLKYTELNEIYWFMSLRALALSLVTIFVPIYLYNLGWEFSNIFLYYIYLYFFEFFFEYLAASLIKKFGPKHVMIASLPPLIFHVWQLLTMAEYRWSPVFLAISLSLSLAFFWEGYHYDFSRAKHAKRATKEVGKVLILLTVISSLGPFLGGVMADFWGINYPLTFVILLLFIASMFLLKTKDSNFRKGKLDLQRVNINNIKKHIVSYVGLGWESVSGVQIWPLFLFLIVGSYEGVGLITSFSLVLSVFVIYYLGKKADEGKRLSYLKKGSFAVTIASIAQVFVKTPMQAALINLVRALAQSIFKPPFDSEYYLHADEEARSEYIYFMESAVDFSRLIFYLILFYLSLIFPLKFVLICGLLMGACGSALIPLMPPAKCEICGPIENKKIKVMPRPR